MSSSNPVYDVFLSYRGKDTRKTFVSHLLHSLAEKSIRVFEDENLMNSESHLAGIRASKTAIVVISANYASSSWCVDDLVQILEFQRKGSLTIIPVYYGVGRSDVQRQTGKFGEQFLKQEIENPDKIKRWRGALNELAKIQGLQSEHWEDEAALIQEITDVLWNRLSASNFCGPVGMDHHMKTMYKLLDLHDEHGEVREIGICGRGGIGKTTLARYVYRLISCYFDVHVLLEDVNKVQKELQSKLIQASLSTYMISRDGIASFTGKRVLLLADGVDTIEQIFILRKDIKLFGPGSRVIFTCQDKHLFSASGINHLYQVEPMVFSEALQFFSSCAFRQIHPPRGFENLSVRAVKLADGLPFMVAAVGSELYGRSKEEWEMVLSRYERSSDEETKGIEKITFGVSHGSGDRQKQHKLLSRYEQSSEEGTSRTEKSNAGVLEGFKLYDRWLLPHDHSFDEGILGTGESSFGVSDVSKVPGRPRKTAISKYDKSSDEGTNWTRESSSDEISFSPHNYSFGEGSLETRESSFGVSDVSKVLGRIMEEWKMVLSKYEQSFYEGIIGTYKSSFGVSDDEDRSVKGKNTKLNCVGMDSHIQAVCGGLMELESDNGIRIVGIWGVGGVGKTTLARCVYEETMPHFHTHVFLENVAKIYQDHGSSHLQEEVLLENIQRSSKNGSDVTKARLGNRKVLLIVDGVDNIEQLEDVQKVATWFGAGSRVIVTTRDKNLLVDNGVRHVYEVKCLKVHEALQLFYQFAFKQQTPSTRFKQLSVRAAQLSGRIPLALEVLASFLRGKSENDWESILQKLERQQSKDIVEVAQTSIDVIVSSDEEDDDTNDEESDDDDDDDYHDNKFFKSHFF